MVLRAFLLLLVSLVTIQYSSSSSSARGYNTSEFVKYSFEQYIQEYGKTYPSKEMFDFHAAIFAKNLANIIAHNERYDYHWQNHEGDDHTSDRPSFRMGINQFIDVEWEKSQLKGYVQNRHAVALSSKSSIENANEYPFYLDHVDDLPQSVDWREKGVVTPVKSQGGCGSCWAFATTAVLESHIAIRTGTLFELSMQQFVSCMSNPRACGGTGGCAGATSELAFEHVENFGIVSEWNFGYQSFHGQQINCTLPYKEPYGLDYMSMDSSRTLRTAWGSKGELVVREDNKTFFREAVASIVTHVILPRNNYTVRI
jgi:cathepsin L